MLLLNVDCRTPVVLREVLSIGEEEVLLLFVIWFLLCDWMGWCVDGQTVTPIILLGMAANLRGCIAVKCLHLLCENRQTLRRPTNKMIQMTSP